MEGIGILCQSIGALLIVGSQFEMNRIISIWLQTLDMTVHQLVTNARDIVRFEGVDRHWIEVIDRDRWLSPIGWLLFVAGEVILLWHLATAGSA
jgi:hypothetical protein